MSIVCRYRFPDEVNRKTIEMELALALVAAECAYGQARVRNSAAYAISDSAPQVAIDVSTEVGEHIAQVFTGMMIRQLGETGFSVERASKNE